MTYYCYLVLGGWTLIYRTILQSSDLVTSFTTVDNYRSIFIYKNNQLSTVTVLNQLRQDMGFGQVRFYCYKKLVGRTLHIMTKDSPEGELVIRYFTNSTERPAACGSFTALPDDNSAVSQQCSQWGFHNGATDEKWGSSRSIVQDRLYSEPIWSRLESKHILRTKPIRSLLYCDDHWDNNIQHSAGDFWLIFVR